MNQLSGIRVPQAWPRFRSSSVHVTAGPVGRQEQSAVGDDLDAVAARLERVEEARLLHGVLGGTAFDPDARVEVHVGGSHDVLARVHRERDVVEPTAHARRVDPAVREVVRLRRDVQPRADEPAVVADDLLADAEAERLDHVRATASMSLHQTLTWSRRRMPTPRVDIRWGWFFSAGTSSPTGSW